MSFKKMTKSHSLGIRIGKKNLSWTKDEQGRSARVMTKAATEVEGKVLRSFGLMVGGVFSLIGFWPLLIRAEPIRLWALIVTGLLVIPAVTYPKLLIPIYNIWMRIGAILGWVNTRIILAIGFFLIVTPIGLMLRMFKKDPLPRDLDVSLESYRHLRLPRPNTHMQRQF